MSRGARSSGHLVDIRVRPPAQASTSRPPRVLRRLGYSLPAASRCGLQTEHFIQTHSRPAASRTQSSFGAHPRKANVLTSCSSQYPTVELAAAAVDFGAGIGRATVVDIRDFWPDIFTSAVPRALRPLARLVVSGMKRQSARVLGGATAITGITRSFVEWGVARAGRTVRVSDRGLPARVRTCRADARGARGRAECTHGTWR